MKTAQKTLPNKKLARQRGASMVEYALLVALIALIVIAGVRSAGDRVSIIFENTSNGLAAAGGFPCTPTPFNPC